MRLFDTHAHLTSGRFDGDRDAVVGRAARLGVAVLTAGTDLEDGRRAVACAHAYPDVHAAVGFYPHDTAGLSSTDWTAMETLAEDGRVVAVGEIGLDYHHRDGVPPAVQRDAFARQLALARALGKPALVHCRQAEADVRAMLDDHFDAGGRAAWHCFTTAKNAYADTVRWAAARGLTLGIGGMATWPDQKALRGALAGIPDDLLLLETDAPYLTPRATPSASAALADYLSETGGTDAYAEFPAVGRRNEPVGVLPVAAALAALRGVRVADIARITTRNTRALFGLPADAEGEPAGRVAYVIRDQLYIALTNRCNNNCGFCARNTSWVVKGHDIRLAAEPDADAVLAAMDAEGGADAYREVVFCGFGEPLLRLDTLVEVTRRLRAAPGGERRRIRVNTNGTAGLSLGRDPVPALAAAGVTALSVSLNAPEAAQYAALCRPDAGAEAAYAELERFVRAAVAAGMETTCTVVALPDVDVAACEARAAAWGARFRARPADHVG